jgi:NAD(P)-dependent dehydrogenase (short-subunit alcohol dehydrogenase family)
MSVKKLFDLNGRKALVTGSSRGIGRAIALALAEAGAAVAVHGVKRGAVMDEALAEIKALGGAEPVGLEGDLGVKAGLDKLIASCREAFGAPDILVLNASIQAYMPLEDFEPEEFDKEYSTNLKSAFVLVKEFLPDMKAKGWGRVLSIGSVNQWRQSPRLPIYASSKSALANFMVYCSRNYSRFGITSNTLAPGVIVTDRNREVLKDKDFSDKLLESVPVGRFGAPSIAPR